MGSVKKLPSVPADPAVLTFLSQLSKAALLDCLVDAIALAEGDAPDALDIGQVRAFVVPRLEVRGDRIPGVSKREKGGVPVSRLTYVPGGHTEAKLAAEYFCKALLHFHFGSFVNASFWLKEADEMAGIALEDWGRRVASHHVGSIGGGS